MFGIRKRAEERIPSGLSVLVPAVLDEAAGENPLYRLLCGVPVVARTLLALNQISLVDEIIVVVYESEIQRMARICKDFSIGRVRKVVCAREAGIPALTVGVYECERSAEYIAVHHPLCPFVTAEIVERAYRAALAHGAAAPGVTVRDTVKIVARDDIISETPDRAALRALQYPVLVESSLLKAALIKADEQGVSEKDVPAILEALPASLRLTKGREENIQVEEAVDIPVAEAILGWR